MVGPAVKGKPGSDRAGRTGDSAGSAGYRIRE